MEVELCQGLPKALFPHLWHPGMEIQLDSPHIPSWQLPVRVEMVPNPKLKEELNNSSNFCPPLLLPLETGWENSVGRCIDTASSGMPEGELLENYPGIAASGKSSEAAFAQGILPPGCLLILAHPKTTEECGAGS